ncbi:hypothetical protein VTH06DRAFT_2933 [Thermothelomyces fergusii]
MLVKSIAALAAFTLAANAIAEPMPYKPSLTRTTTRSLFGIGHRQDAVYQPAAVTCGDGDTCAEACGAGYETCVSNDDSTHCYNPTVGEICCPNQSGGTCDKGYYCTADKDGETYCCPEGMDVEECAAVYNMPGELTLQTPPPASSTSTSTSTTTTSSSTSTSTSSSSTTTTTTTTTSTESTTTESTSTTESTESSTESSTPSSTSDSTPTPLSFTTSVAPPVTILPAYVPSGGPIPINSTTVSTVVPPQPTQTKIEEGAGSAVAPATALVLLAAGIAALF